MALFNHVPPDLTIIYYISKLTLPKVGAMCFFSLGAGHKAGSRGQSAASTRSRPNHGEAASHGRFFGGVVNDRVATVPLLPDKPRHEKHGTSPLRLVPVGGCRRQQKDGGYGQVAEDLVARAQVAGEGWWLGSDCRDPGGKGTGCSQAGRRRRMVA